jgi:hypothetical protein
MHKAIRIGYSLAGITLLVLTLACGASVAAIHQRVVPPPRLEVRFAGYRVFASPLTIRSKPPKYYYSVWLFVTSYQPGSRVGTETGEQIMLLPLRSN